MAVRANCLDLIHRLRRYAGDPYSHTQFFSDDDLQDILDRHRIPWIYWELLAVPTITTQGFFNYTDYYARGESGTVQYGDWEKGYLLQGPNWATVTPATSDENTGHWTFNLAVPGQLPPVRITGYSYELMGAAAECWETRANTYFGKFDATSQGTTARRSQMYDHCCDRAEHFKMQMAIEVAQLVRTDIITDVPGYLWRPTNALT
jgi:hypothetical protein